MKIIFCPICNLELQEHSRSDNFSCIRCGDYQMSQSLILDLQKQINEDQEKIAIISHAIRKMQGRETPKLTTDEIDNILKNKLPNPSEQADNLVLWFGGNAKGPGEPIHVPRIALQSIVGAKTLKGFNLVLRYLIESKLLEGRISDRLDTPDDLELNLSFEGWRYFEQLTRGKSDSRKAFMAMQFGDAELNEIVDNCFKDAVRKTGFDLVTLSDRPKAGLIDDRLRVEIRTSKFLIADLTHRNEGAYWEAGFAEGLGKPVIYTCKKSKFKKKKTHFDTNHHLTILWNKEAPAEAAESLKATIRATLPDEAKLSDD